MKSDKYLKVILTIIAICLVWICVRDVKIGGSGLLANTNGSGQQEVRVVGFDESALELAVHMAVYGAIQVSQPIQVSVRNPEPEIR